MAKNRSVVPANKLKAPKKIALPKIGTPMFQGAPDGKKVVLQLGIMSATESTLHASFKKPEWHAVRVDARAEIKADYTAPVTNLSMIGDQTVDAVWCPQILQKILYTDVPQALKETFRVLKNGGSLYLSVPDGQIAGTYLANNRLGDTLYTAQAGNVTSLDLLYGFQPAIKRGNTSLQHYCVFTLDAIAAFMRESGFTNIQIKRDNFELQVVAMRFADDDPKRVERTTITQNNRAFEGKDVPAVPPIPAQQVQSVAYRSKPNIMGDELDQPPLHPFTLVLPK